MAKIVSFGGKKIEPPKDTSLDNLVTMTNQTCVIALDKVLNEIELESKRWINRSDRVYVIYERVRSAAGYVKACLPK